MVYQQHMQQIHYQHIQGAMFIHVMQRLQQFYHFLGEMLSCLVQESGVLKDRRQNMTRRNIDIFVINVDKLQNLKNARPCINCLMMMRDLNINKVYYSTNEGTILCEKIKNMYSITSSLHARCHYIFKNNIKVFDSTLYYEKILIDELKYVASIKEYNLKCFIKHNLMNVLPNLKIIIKNNICTLITHDNNKIILTIK
jgi:hypothetical protein